VVNQPQVWLMQKMLMCLQPLNELLEIRDFAPQNVRNVSKEGQAMASIMDDFHSVGGIPIDQAWAMAREQIYNQTPEQKEIRELGYREYVKDNLSNPDQIMHKAKKLLNAPFFTDIPDMPYVANRVNRLWKDWYMATGSTKSADKLTAESLKHSYGVTYANGVKQFVFMPIESVAGVTKQAAPIIHEDISKDVGYQLEATKAAYDEGVINWYYRVKERSEKDSGPVKVERIYRGSGKNPGAIEEYSLQVTASNNLQMTANQASPYAGYYDIGLIDAKGQPAPIASVTTGQYQTLGYRPNIQFIQNEYTRRFNQGLTAHDMEINNIEEFIKSTQAPSLRERAMALSERSTKSTQGDAINGS